MDNCDSTITLMTEWPAYVNKISYAGAYMIFHYKTRKMYVGHTQCLYNRKHQHLSRLKSNTHSNKNLQSAFNDDSNVSFHVIQMTENKQQASTIEQQFLDMYFEKGILFNLEPVSDSSIGVVRTDEQKQKLSYLAQKQWSDPELRARQSENTRNFLADPDNKARMIERAKEAGSDPVFKESQRQKANEQWSDPERRLKKSLAVKEYFKSPENKLKAKEARKHLLKPVSINGIIHESIDAAAVALGVNKYTIRNRIFNKYQPLWFYSNEGKKCRLKDS